MEADARNLGVGPEVLGDVRDGHEMRSWIVGVATSMAALSAVCVALRLLSRRLMQQKLWWDDRFIIISMCANLICVIFIFTMFSQGLGLPATEVSPKNIRTVAQLMLGAEITYTWNLCFTKISVLLMYYRVFHLSNRSPVYLYILGAFVVTWSLTSSFLFIFICVPVQKLWVPELPGHCVNLNAMWTSNAAATILTDLLVILFPIPHLLNMRLRGAEKAALAFLFAIGFFVVFTSAYCLSSFYSYDELNPTYTLAPPVCWTEVQISAGIVAACLPLMSPIVGFTLRKTGFEQEEPVVFSGGSWASRGKKYSADSMWPGTWPRLSSSRKPSRVHNSEWAIGTHRGAQELPSADAWDWERNVESLTRASELCNVHHQASAERSTGAQEVDVPLNGISVVTDFRRFSVVAPSIGPPCTIPVEASSNV